MTNDSLARLNYVYWSHRCSCPSSVGPVRPSVHTIIIHILCISVYLQQQEKTPQLTNQDVYVFTHTKPSPPPLEPIFNAHTNTYTHSHTAIHTHIYLFIYVRAY